MERVTDYCNRTGGPYKNLDSYYTVRTAPNDPKWLLKWENDYVMPWCLLTMAEQYVPNEALRESLWSDLAGLEDQLERLLTPDGEVRLANTYYLTVGDTFQLFYEGVIRSFDALGCGINVLCEKGDAYPRYWQFTPTAEDVGSYSLTIQLRRTDGTVYSTGKTTVVVEAPPSYDADVTYNLLCFGDSLTANGTWAAEGIRRLVGSATTGYSGPDSLRIPHLNLSSYGSKTVSSGEVKFLKDVDQPIQGYDVLIVEDIVDSGRTLSYLRSNFESRKPASIRVCCLLDKKERREVDVQVDYVGFEIPDAFVVGYGLDYDGTYRNLPYIGVLSPEAYANE